MLCLTMIGMCLVIKNMRTLLHFIINHNNNRIMDEWYIIVSYLEKGITFIKYTSIFVYIYTHTHIQSMSIL